MKTSTGTLLSGCAVLLGLHAPGCALDVQHNLPLSAENGPSYTQTSSTQSALSASRHVQLGIPVDDTPDDDYLMDKGVYYVSYNPVKHVPNWVSWNLEAADLGRSGRTDRFRSDASLPSDIYRVSPRDYTGSGYDRGHLCPSGDRTRTSADNAATFLMTNMQPQRAGFNRGPWQQLEDYERMLARNREKNVFVIAGGVFRKNISIAKGIAVPSQIYKIVVVLEHSENLKDVTPNTRVLAVMIPNEDKVENVPWSRYLVSVDDIEEATGYDFLCALPSETQEPLEARVADAQAAN